ncbi:MAG TPA: hypothetical protein VGQ41_12635 [Pyrinomonadaceae bacterium]|jgi:hypothetical protein|nr:hypothetical protein [Pyrinomonadaceae bacterium]
MRTFSEWDDEQPGFLEMDLVGHDGGVIDSHHAFTLNAPADSYGSPNYQQFRWNAIANTVVAELLHHARDNGVFSDRNLDSAALKVMDPTKKPAALALMKSKDYRAGIVGHRLVIANCRSTNPYGPPPPRN